MPLVTFRDFTYVIHTFDVQFRWLITRVITSEMTSIPIGLLNRHVNDFIRRSLGTPLPAHVQYGDVEIALSLMQLSDASRSAARHAWRTCLTSSKPSQISQHVASAAAELS